ncbi:hypothetical protein CAEBREN_29406 [Caenorhabditis brenneri]|uniref:Carboxylesterase type B domain-containing protein n=1 Tax=Caenorhabditis brenneri TaxID=135651 RepID=G0NEY9_CAEBE|nr:hypothetical protein CAEBREN_29406 [Caenorhabditis brenneri]
MMGTTTAELRETIYITNPNNTEHKDDLLKNMCEHIGYEVYLEPEVFVDKCITYYSNGTKAQYLSDDMEFYSRAVSMATTHTSKNTKVFLYSYAYSGAGPAFNKYMNVPSPHHSEDLIYTFGTHRGPFAPKDYVIEQIYSGFFANFVNFKDPTISKNQPWLQYTPEKREHFLIDFDENFTMPGMRDDYYADALQFWSTVGNKSFSERWSPSLDTFLITNLVAPIVSHLTNVSIDVDKTMDQMEELFFERENFLEELKLERRIKLKGMAGNGSLGGKEQKKTGCQNGEMGVGWEWRRRDMETEGWSWWNQ